jgi:glyoxylate carboligase
MTDASDVLVERLIAWGVDTIFGRPGDGINGVFEALRKQKDRIRFIHVRHEESAAFMACAYAKFTGRLGVCIATSGPGGMPAEVKASQALKLAEALVRGEPNRMKIALTNAHDTVRELI